MTNISNELFNNSGSEKGLQQLKIRVRPSQRQKIEQLSKNSGCSLAEAARRILDTGLEHRGEA